MPPRPSRNVDQLLIQAGHELLPQTGVRGLSIRQVTERAGVNLGMFHYHFKTKDVFVRAILEQKYNDMFRGLETKSRGSDSALINLRAAVTLLARWGRDNRVFWVRLLGDAFAGEKVALEFMRANMPRHIEVVIDLVLRAQKEGELRKMPIQQALAFLMGALAAPIVVGTAAINSGFVPEFVREQLEQLVFTDAAIEERVEMALLGMAAVRKTGRRK
ncbi:MAG TPA: TetR/AcrR family transcriptional regulator [Usitatibacteraceae bacterium]